MEMVLLAVLVLQLIHIVSLAVMDKLVRVAALASQGHLAQLVQLDIQERIVIHVLLDILEELARLVIQLITLMDKIAMLAQESIVIA
jgi:predicted nucleic acid-binding protein